MLLTMTLMLSANILLLVTDSILSILSSGYMQMALYRLEPGSFVACIFTSLQMSQDTPCGRVVPHKRVYLHTSFKLLAAGPRTLSKFIFVSTQFYLRHSYSAVPNPQPPCLAVSNRPSCSYVYLSTFCYILEFLTLPTRLSVYFILPSLIPL